MGGRDVAGSTPRPRASVASEPGISHYLGTVVINHDASLEDKDFISFYDYDTLGLLGP